MVIAQPPSHVGSHIASGWHQNRSAILLLAHENGGLMVISSTKIVIS